ncbi:ATP phosphoribosyltransferase [Peptostreptococcus faecalis]|uniref:ATP phosphoribosyltransferase n=1 Tax=Peptostreptococcus faecalis TaxID=2045015 RepID=UPI000C7CCFC7|nr:ATP phosphoribosyltransferase [Peptostreptococcus faecalis]
MINIALPKGRLGDSVYSMFEKIGLECSEILSNTRALVFEVKDKGIRYLLVKPSDVAIYVERGTADIGVVGSDILAETSAEVYELLDLDIGKCNMVVAAKKDWTDDLDLPLRVATKYTRVALKYFEEQSRPIDIIKLNGSIELAPLLGLSDIIVDIVETGTTLKKNDLVVHQHIMPISARLIANKSSYKFNYDKIDEICKKMGELV